MDFEQDYDTDTGYRYRIQIGCMHFVSSMCPSDAIYRFRPPSSPPDHSLIRVKTGCEL